MSTKHRRATLDTREASFEQCEQQVECLLVFCVQAWIELDSPLGQPAIKSKELGCNHQPPRHLVTRNR